jgi:Na+-transporting NADH:ubiquinone oxidoreductase subunit C
VICGVLLAVAAVGLKPKQDENVLMEQKKNILATVITLDDKSDIKTIYDKRVKEYVIDFEGEVVADKKPADISVAGEYKKAPEQRQLPVYEVVSESDPSKTEFYVFPIYGYGLWNNIWGYVSLKSDMNTINGVKFEHAGETPGLGARIATDEIQKRYQDKKVFDDKGALMSVAMQKGEGIDYSSNPHQVDGMSGATITGKGVNNMMTDYLSCYQNFLKSKKGNLSLNK